MQNNKMSDIFDKQGDNDKFLLNVIQGQGVDMEHWYSEVKGYDFLGWAFGGGKKNRLAYIIDIILRMIYDGKFEKNLADVNLQWRGSSNQRCIDVKKELISLQSL